MIKPYKYYIAQTVVRRIPKSREAWQADKLFFAFIIKAIIIMIIYTPVASILIGLITILLHNYYDNMVGKIIIYFTGISAVFSIFYRSIKIVNYFYLTTKRKILKLI